MTAIRSDLTLPWGRVSYVEWRTDRARPRATVLLLHGGGVDSALLSWGRVGPALAESGYRVIAPDHPGYGESPAAPWQTTQIRLVEYVGEVADGLGLKRYVVGGLSLGGGMAIGHVLARPQPIDGAILLGSYGLMERLSEGPLSLPAQLATWAMLRSGALAILMRAYAKNRKHLQRSMRSLIRDPSQLTPQLLDDIEELANRPGALTAFEQWQRDQVQWNRLKTNYFDRLGTFATPALIVHGEQDSGVPVACARRAAEQIPDARLVVVPDAGHWVQRDRPGIVIAALREFLDLLNRGHDATPADR